jgi:peptidoglycan-associated lipoprotein
MNHMKPNGHIQKRSRPMRPVNHGVLLLGILSFSFMGLIACGEKRIHVATVSGTPGEELNSSPVKADTSGLSATTVDESSLTGATPSTEEVQADAVLPVAPVEPLHFAHEPSLPASSDEPSMQEPQLPIETQPEMESAPASAEGSDLSDPLAFGQNIETQSGSFTPNDSSQDSAEGSLRTASSGSQDDQPSAEHTSILDGLQMAEAEPKPSFPDDQSSQQIASIDEEVQMGEAEPAEAFDNEELSPHLTEQIPDKVQLAKAEPSDILREQLDKIKEEELATASAGLEDVFFQFDSWTLTAEAKESLERDMGWLSNEPSSSLIIEGHADQRGTQAYNMILGKKRAMAIRDYFSQLGVDPSRLTVISYGKDKPFCQDLTEVCHQLNRRGHLLVQN